MPKEMAARVEERVRKMEPWVTGVSAYVRRLIALDEEFGLIANDGSISNDMHKAMEAAKDKRKRKSAG